MHNAVGVEVPGDGVVAEFLDHAAVGALDEDGVVAGLVGDGSHLFHVWRACDDETTCSGGGSDGGLELHVLRALSAEDLRGVEGVAHKGVLGRAVTDTSDDVVERTNAERGGREVAPRLLRQNGDAVGRKSAVVAVDDVTPLVHEELAGEGKGALESLLRSAEQSIVATEIFRGPCPLHTAAVLGVVEARQSVTITPVRSTARDGCELGTSVLAACDDTLVPQRPVVGGVEADVARRNLHTGLGKVVGVTLAVRQGEETRDLEVEAPRTSGQDGAQGLVRFGFPEGAKEGPVSQVVGRCSPERDARTNTLDARAEDGVVVRFIVAKDVVHLWPRLYEWVAETGQVPAHRLHVGSGINDGVVFVALPGLAAVFTVGDALGLGVGSVVNPPVGGQVCDARVEDGQCSVDLALQVDWLRSTTEDTKAVIAAIARGTKGKSISALPAANIGPGDQVLASSMTPTDVAPVDVLGVPLVEEMVCIARRIVHGSAWIVHPSCRCKEVVLRPPAGEQ